MQVSQSSVQFVFQFDYFQERGDVSQFKHNNVTLKFKLDNEFELVFVVSEFFKTVVTSEVLLPEESRRSTNRQCIGSQMRII